jgi:uncharacterized membrane protein YebE (DUF533 family)
LEPTATPPGAPIDPASFEPGHRSALDSLVGNLAEKVLHAWLKQKLRKPAAEMDLRDLDRREIMLLVHSMVAAAEADGTVDSQERARMGSILAELIPGGHAREIVERDLTHARPLNAVVAAVANSRDCALVYIGALLVADRSNPVNRHYLNYLAARLQMSQTLVEALESRYARTA